VKRAALILALAAAPAWGQSYPESLTPWVSDHADLLDDAAETRLNDALRALREDPGTEIAVVTIGRRSDYGAHQSIETFATGLFNDWGIGDAERDNGILILVAVDDREMRIELGEAYSTAWDTVAENVIDNTFLPRFRDDAYQEGIERGTYATIDRIAVPFARNLPPPERGLRDWLAEWAPAIIFGTAFAGFLAAFAARVWTSHHPRCPNCGRRKTSRDTRTLEEASPDHPGEAEETVTCRNCDYRGTRTYSVPYRTASSRSSGGSGFGGGSSSGGGASGRW
jgi:uncharacterized protein